VGRDIFADILAALGAEVIKLGYSDNFVPVDTEAIRPQDVQLAREWSAQYAMDALVSADGDADRPLVGDEHGEWLRGDVACIFCARLLGAHVVATPVSSNTAVERSGYFKKVLRTRIGSPYVVAAMQQALADGDTLVVGYEANGGFLTASDITVDGKTLKALPTRDAILVPLAILALAAQQAKTLSQLVATLPQRFTASNRVERFPTDLSRAKLAHLHSGDFTRDKAAIEAVFGADFGRVASLDSTDGLRITFSSGEIVHLRPSGNAPEFRCYNEADSAARAQQMNDICMHTLETWRR
jgi:phosphomannomutase